MLKSKNETAYNTYPMHCVYHFESDIYINWDCPDYAHIQLFVHLLKAQTSTELDCVADEVTFIDPVFSETQFLLKRTALVTNAERDSQESVDILTWNSFYLFALANIWLLTTFGELIPVDTTDGFKRFIVIEKDVRAILIGRKDGKNGTLVSTIVIH